MEHSKAETFRLKRPSATLRRDFELGELDLFNLNFCESETGFELNVRGVTADELLNLLRNSTVQDLLSQQEEKEKRLKIVANALDIDFLQFDDLEVDLLEVEEDEFAGSLDIDFLEQNFLKDILAELNKQLAIKMKSEFDKDKKRKAGQDEFGVILLDEEPEWVWMRTDESGNNIVLRLNQENGYIINVTQGDTEIMDYELGDGDNVINIYQNQ